MMSFFNSLVVIALVSLLAKVPIEKGLAQFKEGKLLGVWHFTFRAIWGAVVWLMLTVFSSAGLHDLFPNQETYIFSGSWITLLPALLWGLLISWIVLGKTAKPENGGLVSTYEDRLDAAISGTGRAMKYAFYALLAVLGIIAFFLFGTWINNQVSEMPASSAIIVGAMIIAWAIVASRKS